MGQVLVLLANLPPLKRGLSDQQEGTRLSLRLGERLLCISMRLESPNDGIQTELMRAMPISPCHGNSRLPQGQSRLGQFRLGKGTVAFQEI